MGEDIVTVRDFIENEIDNRIGSDGAYFDEVKQALAAFERIVADRRALSQALKPFADFAGAEDTARKALWHATGVPLLSVHLPSGTRAWSIDWPDFHRAVEVLQPSAPDEIARAQTQGEG
jgi:hypothetical protein